METADAEYDPMVVVAANRQVIALKDGTIGRLVYWSTKDDQATILTGGRHVRFHKDDLLCVQDVVDD